MAVFELLGTYPPILGHPGQPGYRLVAIAEQEASADIFKGLDTEERGLLAPTGTRAAASWSST